MSNAWAVVLAALIGGLFAWWARRVDRRATRELADAQTALESRKVGRDDFDSITRELNLRIERLGQELEQERDERRVVRRRDARRITQLEQVIRDMGGEIPPPVDDDDL